MPKKIIDYSKTIIYRIVCNDVSITDNYVGSTTNFKERLRAHRKCKKQYRLYQYVEENGGWDNFSMIEIEKFPCIDGNEARARERYWIEYFKSTLNMVQPHRTMEEYKESKTNFSKSEEGKDMKKRDYEKHKDAYILRAKKRYEEKKEDILIKAKQRYRDSKENNF